MIACPVCMAEPLDELGACRCWRLTWNGTRWRFRSWIGSRNHELIMYPMSGYMMYIDWTQVGRTESYLGFWCSEREEKVRQVVDVALAASVLES